MLVYFYQNINSEKYTNNKPESSWDNNYYGQFLHFLSPHKRKTIRKWEKLNKKHKIFHICHTQLNVFVFKKKKMSKVSYVSLNEKNKMKKNK